MKEEKYRSKQTVSRHDVLDERYFENMSLHITPSTVFKTYVYNEIFSWIRFQWFFTLQCTYSADVFTICDA